MKPSPRGSSSDLERARAAAERLSREPGDAPPPDDGAGYTRFSARGIQRVEGAAAIAPERPAPAERPHAPVPAPTPPPEAAPPPAPPRQAALEEEHTALEDTSPPDAEEPGLEVRFEAAGEEGAAAGEGAGAGDAEDIIEQLVADAEEESAPEPPSWAQVLETCVAISDSRAAIILDAEGHILEASEQLPRNKLDAIAARTMQTMEGVGADPSLPAASRSTSVQLGAFWLTGLRVPIGPEHVTIGLIAPGTIAANVLPAVEAELAKVAPG